jgi:small subunit ribosomal protein S1
MSRHTSADAWAEFAARHGVGDVVEGDVVSVEPFGAFVRVGEVDGLAPTVEWPVLPEVGATVRVRILAVDLDRQRAAFGPV